MAGQPLPSEPTPAPPSSGPKGWRGLALLFLVGAGASLLALWQHGATNHDLQQLVRAAGADQDAADLSHRITRQPDLQTSRLTAGRALVYHVLNIHAQQAAPDAKARAVSALPRARALMLEVLADQPNNWQAAMLLGTSYYLEWSLGRDRRLFTAAKAWEKPLSLAVDRSGHPEPQRLLATVYLEIWSALSPAKKEHARQLLQEVFRNDLRAFQALMPAWLATPGSLDEKLAIMPDEPAAWANLERVFGTAHNWRAVEKAYAKRMAALLAKFETRRLEASRRLELGDYYNGRALLLQNLVEAPHSRRFLPEIAASLELYPPGLHGLDTKQELRDWLGYLLELDRVDVRPLEPELMGRLLDAAGELPPEVGAHAALLAGDIYQAERYERLTESFQLDAWGPYLVAKARWAIGRQDMEAARQSLDFASIGWRRQLPYLAVRRQLTSQGVRDNLPFLPSGIDESLFERMEWPASAWQKEDNRPTLEFWAPRALRGFELEIDRAGDHGVAIELSLDGTPLAVTTIRQGERLRASARIPPGLHRLTLEPLAQVKIHPGQLRLVG